ncbi:MAG: DNA transformation protein [Bacteroidia bacterium]|jgi:DNA transformation protein
MGVKGDKQSSETAQVAELLLAKLSPIDGVTTKKMFGGYGIFHDSKMLGLINPKANVFLKFDADSLSSFEKLGGEQRSKMPYYSVPSDYLESNDFIGTVEHSIKISK